MSQPSMREQMPWVAGLIDELRASFGKEDIDNIIRRGLRADCSQERRFYASESGHVLGLRPIVSGIVVSLRDVVLVQPKRDADQGNSPKRYR